MSVTVVKPFAQNLDYNTTFIEPLTETIWDLTNKF